MAATTYKKIELVGSSQATLEDAIEGAVTKASETIRNMRWFQVTETRGYIENGVVAYWQVTLKVGFRLES